MKYLFFDLETTSRFSNNARILQLAYILVDEDLSVLDIYNQYFATDREVPESASQVNGLTRMKLAALSKGTTFGEVADELEAVFCDKDVVVCGFNSNSYDIPIMTRYFDEHGVDSEGLKNCKRIDVFREAKKLLNGKLGSFTLESVSTYAIKNLGMTTAEFKELFTSVTGSDTTGYHGALFDSFATLYVALFLQLI